MLSNDQIFLINTLSYLQINAFSPQTDLKSIALTILTNPGKYQEDFQSVEQITDACQAIINDPTVSKMTLGCAEISETGSVRFVVTTHDAPKEALVVFRGTTTPEEWHDDFIGGATTDAPDGVSTDCQMDALAWYQSSDVQNILRDCTTVTTTGHSKGGNNAKYITLMDDSVDRCVSFDGQGFSDEFVSKYEKEIAFRQDKITNISAKRDFVNILLNDVGKEHIYIDAEDSNFLANHSLFTLQNEGYPISEHIGTQDEGMIVLNDLINTWLRSFSPSEKRGAMNALGQLVAAIRNLSYTPKSPNKNYNLETLLPILLKDRNTGVYLGKLASIILAYCRDNPKERQILLDTLQSILGLNSFIATPIEAVINFILDTLARFAKDTPDMSINGSDLRVQSACDKLCVDIDHLQYLADTLAHVASSLAGCAQTLSSCASYCASSEIFLRLSLSFPLLLLKAVLHCDDNPDAVLRDLSRQAQNLSNEVSRLSGVMRQVIASYEHVEQTLSGQFATA